MTLRNKTEQKVCQNQNVLYLVLLLIILGKEQQISKTKQIIRGRWNKISQSKDFI